MRPGREALDAPGSAEQERPGHLTPLRTSPEECAAGCALVTQAPRAAYAYLLGQYLGDGSIVHTKRDVYRLTITCCAAYPGIVGEVADSIGTVLPANAVGRRDRQGATLVSCYSKHLPCLFPQHGPGRKHEREIALAPWQAAIALDDHPDQFIRGLIHISVARRVSVQRLDDIVGSKY